MGSTRPRSSTRAGDARSAKSIRNPKRNTARIEDFDQRKAAATLRTLRRLVHKSRSNERPRISPTQAVREIRDGVPTAALNHLRSKLNNARSAARVCADILQAQAADLDGEVALTLERCVCSELAAQIRHINRLLDAGAP